MKKGQEAMGGWIRRFLTAFRTFADRHDKNMLALQRYGSGEIYLINKISNSTFHLCGSLFDQTVTMIILDI
jgi:hypothetical protein